MSGELVPLTLAGNDVEQLPEHLRTMYYDEETGELYLPANVVSDKPSYVWLGAAYDGVPLVCVGEERYYPLTWLAKNYPDCKEWLLKTLERAKRCLEEEAGNDTTSL